MPDFSDLIGVPYMEHGRDLNGLDCYGLALLVENRLGKNLRDIEYDNHNAELSDKYAPTLNVKKKESDILCMGDLLEIRVKNELHIGVVLSKKTFIHATVNHGVKISPIASYPVINIYEVT